MAVKKLKENEIILDIDDDSTFNKIVDTIDGITDVIDDVEIIDGETNEPIVDDEEEEVVDDEIVDEPLEDGEDIESDDNQDVTVNGNPIDDDEELLVEEGDEGGDAGADAGGDTGGDAGGDAGGDSMTEELEVTDYVDQDELAQFFDMDKGEERDELVDPETLDDIIDEEEPSGLMTEDVNDELVDATPRSIPAGLDKIKDKVMAISEEINSLTELTDDVETTSIIADLYNSAVALALDVEGAVDTYKELAEEEIEDEVEEVQGEESDN